MTKGRRDLSNVLSYDPSSNRWRELEPLPEPRSSPVAGVVEGDLIVATGRYVKLNIHRDTWRSR